MPPITLNNRYQYNPDTDLLGEGGLGTVYKAYDNERRCYVAIKQYNVTGNLKHSLRDEFEKSIGFSHGNLVRSYDFFSTSFVDPNGRTHETQYGVMELIEGGDLGSYLQTRPPLPELLDVVKDILYGLRYLHTRDPKTDKGVIIHRDIKPANILIYRNSARQPIPKIADFNIAKEESTDISTQTVVGTPAYMSPEQFLPRKYGKNGKLQPNTDLWSLGVLLCDHLLKKSVFGKRSLGQTQGEITHNVLNKAVPTTEIQNLRAPFNHIIAACLVRHATQRIQSADALLRLINQTEDTVTGDTTPEKVYVPPHPTVDTPQPRQVEPPATEVPSFNRKFVYLLLSTVAVLLLALSFYKWNQNVEIKEYNELVQQAQGDDPFANQMVQVQGGTFTMGCTAEQGSDCDDDEKPAKSASVSTFYISKYEVTQAQWKAVMGSNPSTFKGDDLPVEQVSWDDIQVFLKKLNTKTGKSYRLPTEAQWEYAARGGTITPFHTGKCLSTDQANYNGNYPYQNCTEGQYREKTTPVGSFAPNQYGLYDMSGNVWEWCSDWYDKDYYQNSPANNPKGASNGTSRVLRGGSWSYDARYCRVAYRNSYTPDYRNDSFGFRLALVP